MSDIDKEEQFDSDDSDGDSEEDEEDDNGEEDNEEEEDDDDDDEEDEMEGSDNNTETESESGGEECEVCPICLNKLRRQDIGTPEGCDHCFCLECIMEWSKNVNTCPVDRQVFHIILARHPGEEKIFRQIPVEDKQQNEEEEEDDPTYCEVCHQSDREDRLLLCDGCDLGYHCECLDPPLDSVPVDEWFCPNCQEARDQVARDVPRQHRRQIARTRVSERVRITIANLRIERAEQRQRVSAMMELEEYDEDENIPSTSTSRSTTRKKKSTSKKATPGKKTKGKRKGKRKRKVKGKGKGKGKRTKRIKKSVSYM